jgi:hypothetical protein
LHAESLALRRELGDQQGIAVSLNNLGLVAEKQGEYARAVALLRESLQLSSDIGARDMAAEGLEGLAWSVVAQGQPDRAARLGGAAEALREVLGVPLSPDSRLGHDQALQAMDATLGERACAAAWAAGRAMPLDQAITLALSDTSATP